MQNAIFNEVMAGKPSRRAGETAPDWHAPQMPRMFPKFMLGGLVLVLVSAVLSGPIDHILEKRRIVAQTEAAKELQAKRQAAAKEQQAQRAAAAAARARAELERQAALNAEQVSAIRAKVWRDIESVRALVTDQSRPEIERESARLALEARPAPADLPSSAALDLSAAIQGDAPAVNKALADYQDGTNRVGEYLNQLEDERRRQFNELRRRPRPAPAAAQAPTFEQPAPAPSVTRSAPPAPQFNPPRPPVQQPAKRQVTDW